MKHLAKRGLALLMVLAMCLSMLPAISITADAATTTVTYRYDGEYIYNWGQRDTTATFLSPNAISYYSSNNVTYASLTALAGNADQSSAHTSALYAKLQELMTNTHSYQTSYDATRDLYKYTDCENNGSPSTISSYYSAKAIGPDWDSGATWNREHTWPNSKGLAGSDENDLMMLRPTASSENSARGNKAYGESSGYYDPNSLGQNLHGDVARTILCHYVRWGMSSKMWGNGDDYGVMESKEILLKWMAEDPVDTWEMGRNDSAQSILGYRNVFIDYPELAFELFEAEIPAGYVTPSGEGSASAYQITAVANNASFGTVSLAGTTITAFPATGYEVAGYTVTSGTATVTWEGNAFYVTPSEDCTVQINFQARTVAAVAYMENGQQVSTSSHYVGDTIYLPAASAEAPEGFTFLGWSTATVADTSTKPTFYTAGSSFQLTAASNTFYALYSRVVTDTTVESNMFEKYTGPLVAGDYLLVSNYGAMQAAVSSNRFVVVTGLTFTDDYSTVVSPTEDLIWTVAADGDYFTFYNESTSSYAGGTGAASKGGLLTSVTDYAKWSVSQGEDLFYVMENYGNQAKGVNYTLRRNANYGFACYAATTGTGIELYKRAAGTVYYSTSAVSCSHANTVDEAAVDATCTATGFTAGVLCTDCNTYISGHELIAPLGHNYESVVTEPTETDQGYTTHTCTRCGDSYKDSFTSPNVPVDPNAPTDPVQIVTEAYALEAGAQLSYTPILTGTITSVTTAYNATYGNITVVITVAGCEDKPIKCYRMVGTDVDKIAVGDTITVTGTIVNYQYTDGTTEVEFTAGCVMQSWVHNETPETPDDGTDTPVGDGAILSFADVSNRTEFSTAKQVWTQNGITAINEKASSSSNVADYADPARFYKGSSLEIQATNMAKIVISCSSAAYATALSDSIPADSGATVTVDGSDVIIELAQTSDSFKIDAMSAQVRVTSIAVYAAEVEVPVDGAAFTVSTSVSKLDRGETVTFTASVTSGSAATDYALLLSFDADVFEIMEGTCSVEGAASAAFNNGFVFSFSEATAYTGAIGSVTLVVKDNAAFAESTVTFEASVLNGTEELPAEDCSATVTVSCVHTYDEVVTKPTETEQGYSTFTCSKCGDSYIDDYTKPYGKSYTVTFAVPAGVDAIASKSCNDYGITLPVPGIPEAYSDYNFAGWAKASVSKTEEAPELYATSGKFYTDADVTLYPVYVYTEGGSGEATGDFTLVTDASQLVAGAEVIIAAKDYDFAMGTNQKSNNRGQAAITKSGSTLTYGTDVAVFQLQDGSVSGTYAFYDAVNAGYLYAASSSSNYLRTGTLSDNASWSVAIDADGTATIIAQGTYTRNTMQYNQGSSLFSCYSSASQKAMVLYARSAGGTVYYTSLEAAVPATKVAVGENLYNTVSEALEDTSAEYIVLLEDVDDDLYIPSDAIIDLNGHILTADIYIEDGATLYLFDSATADYTADKRGGIIGAVEGNLATTMNTPASYGHNYKYLTIMEEDGLYSAHRIYLSVKSVSLVPQTDDGSTKISYKTVFKCSDLVASYVDAYGAQLVGVTAVNSAYDIELAAGTNEATVWLTNTLSVANSDEVNAANALVAPAVSAYIQIGNEIITSASVSMSIQDLVVAANAAELSYNQQAALGYMYNLFKNVMDAWTDVDITNIKTYGTYWN